MMMQIHPLIVRQRGIENGWWTESNEVIFQKGISEQFQYRDRMLKQFSK